MPKVAFADEPQLRREEIAKLRSDVRRTRATSFVNLRRLRSGGEAADLTDQVRRRAVNTFGAVDTHCEGAGLFTKAMLEQALAAQEEADRAVLVDLPDEVTERVWLDWLRRVEGCGQSAANVLDWVDHRLKRTRAVHFDSQTPGTPRDAVRELRRDIRELRAAQVVDWWRIRGDAEPVELNAALSARARGTFEAIVKLHGQEGQVTKHDLHSVLKGEGVGAEILFAELDTNHSGDVTMEEWLEWLSRVEGCGQSAENMLDWIEDGLKSAAEHPHVHFDEELSRAKDELRHLKALSVVDVRRRLRRRESGGELSPELASRADQAFTAIDSLLTNDGRITKEELHKVLHDDGLGVEVLFRELDANESGDVTRDEWKAWLARVEHAGQSASNMLDWIEESLERVRAAPVGASLAALLGLYRAGALTSAELAGFVAALARS